jgi:SPP1 gp7 family putative phage head morphogenesis protein
LGATRVAEKFPTVEVGFDVSAPYAQQAILERANQLAGHVTDTTYRAVQQAMVDGVAAGESIDLIAGRIQQVFRQASENRAEMIARTEVLSGFNQSASLAASQLPRDLAAGKEWISAHDHRVRDDHRHADGQTVAIDMPFSVGGSLMPYPGFPGAPPEQVIRCRCTLAILSPDEFAQQRAHRPVEMRAALRALDLVAEGLIDPADIPRAIEAVA